MHIFVFFLKDNLKHLLTSSRKNKLQNPSFPVVISLDLLFKVGFIRERTLRWRLAWRILFLFFHSLLVCRFSIKTPIKMQKTFQSRLLEGMVSGATLTLYTFVPRHIYANYWDLTLCNDCWCIIHIVSGIRCPIFTGCHYQVATELYLLHFCSSLETFGWCSMW